MSQLHRISPDIQDPKADVVFVHGLGGDAFTTWAHDRTNRTNSWPYWLARKFDRIAVHTLDYDASPSYWLGDAMPLQDRGNEVLTEFEIRGIGERPVIFIAHSLGGLVVKQLLREADDRASDRWKALLEHTAAVVFLATPHVGADLATWGARLGLLTRASPALCGLRAHAPTLRGLDNWYRDNAKSWTTHAFYETRATNVLSLVPLIRRLWLVGRLPTRVKVVDEGDADPRITGVIARARQSDHFTICKPGRADDGLCLYVDQVVEECLDENPPTPAPAETSQRRTQFTLPPANPGFVGRSEFIGQIKEALANGGAVITAIEGMGGIGKTATGVEVVHALMGEGKFKDAVAFIDLEGFSATRAPKTPAEALTELLRLFLGTEATLPDELGELQRLWRRATAHFDMLLFLDNAHDEQQIEPLLPGHPTCAVLTTSRNRLSPRGLDKVVDLTVMTPEDGQSLALRLANRRRADRLAVEQAGRLADLCSHLPLSIKLTANALGESTSFAVEVFLAKLAQQTQPLQALEKAKEVVRLSLDALDDGTRNLWQQLGVFDGDFSREAVAAVWASSATDEPLAELERRSLIGVDYRARYRLHDLLRALALEELEHDPDSHQATAERHALYYCDVLSTADDTYLQGGDKVLAGLRIYDVEQRNISVGQAWAVAQMADSDDAARLTADFANAGAHVLMLRLPPREQIVWFEAQRDACSALSDLQGESIALGNMGVAYKNMGEPWRAVEHLEQQLAITREIGYRSGEGRALGNLGTAYAVQGELRRAIEYYEQRLVIALELGDRRGESYTLGNLGNAHGALGEPRRAIDYYEEVLAIARELGDRQSECYALHNWALELETLGEQAEAQKKATDALAIKEEIGHPTVNQTQALVARLRGA